MLTARIANIDNSLTLFRRSTSIANADSRIFAAKTLVHFILFITRLEGGVRKKSDRAHQANTSGPYGVWPHSAAKDLTMMSPNDGCDTARSYAA